LSQRAIDLSLPSAREERDDASLFPPFTLFFFVLAKQDDAYSALGESRVPPALSRKRSLPSPTPI